MLGTVARAELGKKNRVLAPGFLVIWGELSMGHVQYGCFEDFAAALAAEVLTEVELHAMSRCLLLGP